jgi:hypothetical protein
LKELDQLAIFREEILSALCALTQRWKLETVTGEMANSEGYGSQGQDITPRRTQQISLYHHFQINSTAYSFIFLVPAKL